MPIFIIPEPSLRQFDAELFVPLLSDREMEAFTVPSAVQSFVFYPYVGDVLLTETQLSDRFPRTWEFLQSHRVTLERRSAVRKGSLPWWKPERPRDARTCCGQRL